MAGVYEKLQETLEIIQKDLSSAQNIEEQLQKAVSFPPRSCLVNLFYVFVISDFCHQRALGREHSQGLQGEHEHGHCRGRREELIQYLVDEMV